MNTQYNVLDLARLASNITGHPLCFMLEAADFTFTVIFPKNKDGISGLKVSRGLGDGKALEVLFERMDHYTK
jgi:hypothetical protein